jgi:tetratricopeptide (TPR) repeat protein
MKKVVSVVLFVSLVVGGMAQADVTSAFNANKAEDFDKAVIFIEKALNDPKATSKEKTWRYRGNIYSNILLNEQFAAKYPNAAQLATESYFKAMELDKANDYINENRVALATIQGKVLETAAKQYEAGDFCGAAGSFLASGDISQKFGIVDSASIFNNAYCNDRCGKADLAIAGYKRSAEIGYNVPEVYIYMADIYVKQEKLDDAKKIVSEARAKYPNNADLLRSEVNFLLNDKKYDEALELLKSLAAKDDSNPTIWFVLGATHEKLGNVEEQEKAYKKAIELDSKHYDALFNLGATYYNRGIEKLKECDKIPAREKALYNDCTAASEVFFNKSVENLERAYSIRQEKDITSALMEAYARTGNFEGNKKMRAELENMK